MKTFIYTKTWVIEIVPTLLILSLSLSLYIYIYMKITLQHELDHEW